MSPEVKRRIAEAEALLNSDENGGTRAAPAVRRARLRSSTPGRMPSSAPSAAAGWSGPACCYTCRDCGQNTGCS